MRVLLLNPPASKTIIRDYYCSKSTKSNYLFQPIDLLMQSGILAEKHELHAIDAVAKRLAPQRCLAEAERLNPEAVFGLFSAVAASEDRAFYEELSARVSAPVFISGEVALEDPEGWLSAHPFIKGVLLRFVSRGLLHYLERGEPGPDLVVRENGGFKGGLDPDPPREFSLGRPRHELFGQKGYHFSFARGKPFATVLTDFGCPFKCSFCVMATLGYRVRPLAEVAEELKWLKAHGVRELFLTDQCFAARRQRAMEFCELVAREVPGMGWTTFTRADLLDRELLSAMKRAGCHTLIMGVESASQETLAAYRKGMTPEKVERGFALCRELGLRTVATFIIGLPEDTEESITATMKLARKLDPDFVSYNVAVPRAGTTLRQAALEKGLGSPEQDFDQAGDTVAMKTHSLSPDQVLRLKKRAIRDFYLRPRYLLRRLVSARSLSELAAQAKEGAALLLKNI